MCEFVNILVEAFGGNAQLAKSVKYLSGKRHRDEAALLLSMFMSMSRFRDKGEVKKKRKRVCVRCHKMLRRGFRCVRHFALFCFVSVQSTILS